MDWAADQGWQVGYARSQDLQLFQTQGCQFRWTCPTLVIIDYAATKAEVLWAWLARLVQQGEGQSPLRVMLIERSGGPGAGGLVAGAL